MQSNLAYCTSYVTNYWELLGRIFDSRLLVRLYKLFFHSSPRRLESVVPHSNFHEKETLDEKIHQFETLFDDLGGATVRIPSVEQLSPGWLLRKNPHLESIREEFGEWVNVWFKSEKIRCKIHALDAPLFAAYSYPGTGRRELLTMAKWIAWYFPWDDAIDDGSLYYQPEQILRYRDETTAVVKQSLTIGEKQLHPHSNPAIQSFWDLGKEVRSHGTQYTNSEVAKEQCAFIVSSAQSQIEREQTEPVSVEQYLIRREDNIAIHPLLALIYYNYELEIPREWSHYENKHMKIIWRELAWMGTMANDMLSLRREIMNGQYESLVPLLMYHQRIGIQEAMDLALQMVHESYGRFHEAEATLYSQVSHEQPQVLQTVKDYVTACKDLITCNLYWSYGLKRYMDKNMVQPDGSVVFQIVLSSSRR